MDTVTIKGLINFAPKKPLYVELMHQDGSFESIEVFHSYNDAQIEWFKEGSALNKISKLNNQG